MVGCIPTPGPDQRPDPHLARQITRDQAWDQFNRIFKECYRRNGRWNSPDPVTTHQVSQYEFSYASKGETFTIQFRKIHQPIVQQYGDTWMLHMYDEHGNRLETFFVKDQENVNLLAEALLVLSAKDNRNER